jgi:hypothetical protein
LALLKRRSQNRLGWAVQWGTVLTLGTLTLVAGGTELVRNRVLELKPALRGSEPGGVAAPPKALSAVAHYARHQLLIDPKGTVPKYGSCPEYRLGRLAPSAMPATGFAVGGHHFS